MLLCVVLTTLAADELGGVRVGEPLVGEWTRSTPGVATGPALVAGYPGSLSVEECRGKVHSVLFTTTYTDLREPNLPPSLTFTDFPVDFALDAMQKLIDAHEQAGWTAEEPLPSLSSSTVRSAVVDLTNGPLSRRVLLLCKDYSEAHDGSTMACAVSVHVGDRGACTDGLGLKSSNPQSEEPAASKPGDSRLSDLSSPTTSTQHCPAESGTVNLERRLAAFIALRVDDGPLAYGADIVTTCPGKHRLVVVNGLEGPRCWERELFIPDVPSYAIDINMFGGWRGGRECTPAELDEN